MMYSCAKCDHPKVLGQKYCRTHYNERMRDYMYEKRSESRKRILPRRGARRSEPDPIMSAWLSRRLI